MKNNNKIKQNSITVYFFVLNFIATVIISIYILGEIVERSKNFKDYMPKNNIERISMDSYDIEKEIILKRDDDNFNELTSRIYNIDTPKGIIGGIEAFLFFKSESNNTMQLLYSGKNYHIKFYTNNGSHLGILYNTNQKKLYFTEYFDRQQGKRVYVVKSYDIELDDMLKKIIKEHEANPLLVP